MIHWLCSLLAQTSFFLSVLNPSCGWFENRFMVCLKKCRAEKVLQPVNIPASLLHPSLANTSQLPLQSAKAVPHREGSTPSECRRRTRISSRVAHGRASSLRQ